MRERFTRFWRYPTAAALVIVLLVIGAVAGSILHGPYINTDIHEWASATSPDGTWFVKILGKWDSSFYVIYMEAFEKGGTNIGQIHVASLEGPDEVGSYLPLVCSDTESTCGKNDGPYYTVALKTDFRQHPKSPDASKTSN